MFIIFLRWYTRCDWSMLRAVLLRLARLVVQLLGPIYMVSGTETTPSRSYSGQANVSLSFAEKVKQPLT